MIERLTTSHSGPLIIISESVEQRFAFLIDVISRTLATTSRRVYANSFRQWRAFAEGHDIVYGCHT